MKEKLRKTLLMCLVILNIFGIFNFAIPTNVQAATNETLSHSKIDNLWYTRRGGGKPYMSAQYETYTMNGKVVYCIEPGVPITNASYVGYGGLQSSPYDTATNKKIELIGHYGYDYPGHQTLRYRMAAQALIWEATGGQIVEYWTQASGYGDYINVDAERNEIMRLVNLHYNKPSFNGTTINAVLGQEFSITDTNSVLSEYEIYSSNNLNARISGNTIYATPTQPGDLNLTVVRKHYDNFTTIVFLGEAGTSQKMGYFRFSDPILASISIKSIGGDIAINKLDNDTQTNRTQGVEALLSNALYGVYDYNDNLITKITTNENGYAKSETLPKLGDFYLKEITASKGYLLDENKYYFSLSANDLHPTINVYEQIIKRDLEINKYYASAETGILSPEVGIEFEIYDSKNNLVSTIKTDSQGFTKVNLVYGTYTIRQKTTTTGHEKVNDFEIIVNENSPKTIKYSLSNAPVMAKLKLVKVDSESQKTIVLGGITFKIKNLTTNQYVCQQVTYPTKQDICEFKTDDNGEFITPYPLTTGSYQIEEITAPYGYLLSDKAIVFTIDDNSNIVDDGEYGKYLAVEFSNDQIKGKIDVSKLGEIFNVENGTFSYTSDKLKGVKYSLYAEEDIKTLDGIIHYNKGDLVVTKITDDNGNVSFNNLYLGKYIVKETETLEEYVLDTKEYSIELTATDNVTKIVSKSLELENKLKKGTIEFTKTDISTSEPIPNTLIEIYTKNDELIFSGKTNDDGKVIIEELKAGKYYIIEKESATGFVLSEEIVEFEILDNGEIVKAKMTNRPIYGALEFTKTDISTSEPLPNTLIEIYTENDELVFSGKTDESGKITIEELRYGKYYIVEKEAPDGYILNTEKMYFEVKEDGEIVKANMVNEKVIVEVPNTINNNYFILEVIATLCIISGIGVIIYVKKKRKK